MNHQKKKVTYFNNSLHKMIKLSGSERAFLDFILERMDTDNTITIDKDFRENYISFIHKITSGTYAIKEQSLKNMVYKFNELDLLFKLKNGFYLISPKHFTKVSLKLNKEHFLGLQEFLVETTENETLLNTPRKKG
jgi:hypothetical protein